MRFIDLLQVRLTIPSHVSHFLTTGPFLQRTQAVQRQGSQT